MESESDLDPVIRGYYRGYKTGFEIEFDSPPLVARVLGFELEEVNSHIFPWSHISKEDAKPLSEVLAKAALMSPDYVVSVRFKLESPILGEQILDLRGRQRLPCKERCIEKDSGWVEFAVRVVTEQVLREQQDRELAKIEGIHLAAQTMLHLIGKEGEILDRVNALANHPNIPEDLLLLVLEVDQAYRDWHNSVVMLSRIARVEVEPVEISTDKKADLVNLQNSKFS